MLIKYCRVFQRNQQAEEGNYKYTTLKSANARIEELEGQLASESGTTSANSDYIKNLEAKVKQLQKYKDDVDAFNKRVAEFDEKVVFTDNAPDASEYRKYYEGNFTGQCRENISTGCKV